MKAKETKIVRVSGDIHKKLKIYCAQNNLSIIYVLDNLVIKHLPKK